MSYFSDYQARLSITQNPFEKSISNSYQVEINGVLVNAIISANDNGTYKIITQIDDAIGCGDIIEYNGSTFIIISPPKVNNNYYNVATMRLCNLLPFYFKVYDTVYSTYGYYEKSILIDTTLDQAINLPDDIIVVTIPDNADTSKMKRGDTFFIFTDDWYEQYKVNGFDKSVDGLIKIKAEEKQAETTPTEFYALSPTSATIGSVVISPSSATIIMGNNKQLNVRVFDPSGNVMVGETVQWSSSDETVAVVSDTGYIVPQKVGSCLITATSVTDSNIVGKCEVVVSQDEGWWS